MIPTAALMGRATEELAARAGPGIGGFLNVTFGNAPELIIAFFALREGLLEVVKASLVGSILGNVLLVMGAAMLVGGLKRERQTFDRTAANTQSLMLLLACVALIMPAIFELVIGGSLPNPTDKAEQFPSDLEKISFGVAIVLLGTYVAGLFFSLRTHKDLFNPEHAEEDHVGDALVRQEVRDRARDRRRRGRRDVGDPRRLDHRGVGVDRPVAVLRRHHRRRDRRQRRRALGRDLLRLARQDGSGGQHRDRLERPDRPVRRAGARPAVVRGRPVPDGARLQRARAGGDPARDPDRQQVTQEGESTWFEGLQLLAVYAVLGLVFFFV